MPGNMTFCPDCGAAVDYRIPPGDDRERAVCTATGDIFYHNPRNVVGCIVEHEGSVLMCRRAIEPRRGFWTLPAGFLELGETLQAGALRETYEEARASVVDPQLFAMIDVTHIGQVHIFFRGRLADGHYASGQESQTAALVERADIDWHQLAFPTIHRTLERYFADRDAGTFGLHLESLGRHDWKAMKLAHTPDAAPSG